MVGRLKVAPELWAYYHFESDAWLVQASASHPIE